MTTDIDRINAIEEMGNFAVWKGTWVKNFPGLGGKPLVVIYEMDEHHMETGDEISRGETFRDAIDQYINKT